MTHVKRFSFPCMLIIALAFLLPGTGIASAAAITNCGQWNVVSSPNAKAVNVLTSITAISANDVWAAGYSGGSSFKPLLEHWDGSSWQIVASPIIRNRVLFGIAAVSTNDVWAVGNNEQQSNGKPLTEHWNGSQWSIVSSPNKSAGVRLFGVTATSSNDIWAVGLYAIVSNGSEYFALIEHWNGSQWHIVYSPQQPQNDSLAGISAVSSTDIWAVGATYGIYPHVMTLTIHGDGTHWNIVSSPGVGKISQLNGVASVSTNDVWAVGQSGNSSSPNSLIEHWDGSKWSISKDPGSSMSGTILKSVAALSPNNVWAVGQYTNQSGVSQTFIEHWDGNQWSIVSSPNVGSANNSLSGVNGLPGTTQVWAVGNYTNQGTNTLIESYC